MKGSVTVLKFEKNNINTVKNYTTEIEVVFGRNPRGQRFQHVNQIDTANEVISNMDIEFQKFRFSPVVMISIILDHGYTLKY